MKTNELRERYLAFFESKGCTRRPSDVLVPRWDPSVLFTQGCRDAIRLAQRNAGLAVQDVDEIDMVPALDRRGDRPVLRVEPVDGDDPALPVDEDFDGSDRGIEGLFHGWRRTAGTFIALRSAGTDPGSRPDLLH